MEIPKDILILAFRNGSNIFVLDDLQYVNLTVLIIYLLINFFILERDILEQILTLSSRDHCVTLLMVAFARLSCTALHIVMRAVMYVYHINR